MKTLLEIRAEIERLAALIDVPVDYLPTYGLPRGDGKPFIEVDERGYHYVISERGQEYQRLTTFDLERVLYALFRGVTSSMAFKYELRHRKPGQDCRRLAFPKQVELLCALAPNWGERMKSEQERKLQLFPFDDGSLLRAKLSKELRESGRGPEEAWAIASERYPGPKQATLEEGRKLSRELEEEW